MLRPKLEQHNQHWQCLLKLLHSASYALYLARKVHSMGSRLTLHHKHGNSIVQTSQVPSDRNPNAIIYDYPGKAGLRISIAQNATLSLLRYT